RAQTAQQTYVVMDAPPAKEEATAHFVAIANAFRHHHVTAPEVIAADITQGFLLLSDLGNQLYLDHLNITTADTLYQGALETLLRIQQCQAVTNYNVPPYDAKRLMEEMHLFHEWYVAKHLHTQLTSQEQQVLQHSYQLLTDTALAQPTVLVHR